jgi:hypothetical protein
VPRTPGREKLGGTAEEGYLHCGPNGAGHFVKMVHNGIEYGLMAAYAEGLNILKHANVGKKGREVDAETTPLRNPEHYQYDLNLPDIAEVWRRGSVVASWLLDLTASALLQSRLALPPGHAVTWSGEWESQQRVTERLRTVVPLTLLLVLLLLYLSTRSFAKTAIVALAVPFSAVGAIWLVWLLGYNMSVGVWVGLIALLGLDAETGVFMLLYLDIAYEQARKEVRLRSLADLDHAIVEGAAKRLRPKFMTFATTFVGLVPILWASGTGADVMKRIAAPMVGGLFTSFVLELVVYPVIYRYWRWNTEVRSLARDGSDPSAAPGPSMQAAGSGAA